MVLAGFFLAVAEKSKVYPNAFTYFFVYAFANNISFQPNKWVEKQTNTSEVRTYTRFRLKSKNWFGTVRWRFI